MNVLSLFDGISCGRLALEKAGVEVTNYYASEIDKYAIKVALKNYPNTIQLGDVTNWRSWDLPEIDLIIGGSPCQGFSFAGKGLNFEDERSKLFFEYVNLLEFHKPKYFLLENVKMKKESLDIITQYMGVEPIEINSNVVSAQGRKRLYWTNIPGIEQPEDKGVLLSQVIEDGEAEKEKSQTLLATLYKENAKSMVKRNKRGLLVKSSTIDWGQYSEDGVNYRKFTPLECERLQTLPENYTDSVSNTQRYKMIGNGWTVDVISHLFDNIKLKSAGEVPV